MNFDLKYNPRACALYVSNTSIYWHLIFFSNYDSTWDMNKMLSTVTQFVLRRNELNYGHKNE